MKMMHIGDLHLGTRQYGMAQREEDFYDALKAVEKIAWDEGVSLVVISGDVFDSPKPPARAVLELSEFVASLKFRNIKVAAIEGNHDLTADNYWLRVCGIHPLEHTFVNIESGGPVVTGFNFCRSEELLDRLEGLAAFCEDGKPSRFPVVALHCGVAEMGAAFNPDLSVTQLAPLLKRIGCTYCALGHIHIPMEIQQDGIWFVQPGSLEMKSVDEPQDKSVEIVEFDDNGNVTGMKRVPYKTRKIRFENVEDEAGVDRILATDPQELRDCLTVAYVGNAIPNGVSRVADFGKRHELMFRTVPVGDAAQREAAKDFDRHDSMSLLQRAVEEFFDKDSEQYNMVMKIINTGNPRLVVDEFMEKDNDDRGAKNPEGDQP